MKRPGLIAILMALSAHANQVDCQSCGTPASPAATTALQTQLDRLYCEQLSACTFGHSCDLSPFSIAGRCRLRDAQIATIMAYGGAGYRHINQHLWGVRKSEACEAVVQQLSQTLEQLPRYEGVVWRGTRLPDRIRRQHRVGATVTYSAFTSTSTSRARAQRFGTADQFLFFSHTGRAYMGVRPSEAEVLFPVNARFRVVRRVKVGKTTQYTMMEIFEGESRTAQAARESSILADDQALWAQESSWARHLVWRCPTDARTPIPAVVREEELRAAGGDFP